MKLALFTLCTLLVAVQWGSAAPFDIGGWWKDATKAAGDWIDGAVKDSKDWVEGAAKDTKDWVNGAAKDTKDWVNGAAKDTKDWVEGAAKDTKDWVNGAARDTENWFKGAARDTENWFKGAARDTESWVKTAAKDVEYEFNKVGRSITDFFNNMGVEMTKAFVVIKYKWDKFEKDANLFFKNAGEKIKKEFEDIKRRIEETGDNIIQVIFQKIYDGLQDAKNKLQDLSKTADAKFEAAMNDMRDKLFSVTSQIRNFMGRMKNLIDNKRDQKRGMLILDSYLRESTGKIYSCSDAAVSPIRSLYEATKSLIWTTISKLEEFLQSIQGCLKHGVSAKTAKCGKNLGPIIKSMLKDMGSELLGMKMTLINTVIGEVSNVVCISKTRIEVEMKKSEVENAIRNLK